MPKLLLLILIALSACLSACLSPALKPDLRSVAGESAEYIEGYADGCHSGYVSGGSLYNNFKRDSGRILEDSQYRLGWNRAYKRCKDEFRLMCKEGPVFSKATFYCSDVKQQGLDKTE